MSKLLNRGNVFVVTRELYEGFTSGHGDTAVLGVFSELEDADDYKGMCEQQWKEKVGDLKNVDFDIQLTTYYGK